MCGRVERLRYDSCSPETRALRELQDDLLYGSLDAIPDEFLDAIESKMTGKDPEVAGLNDFTSAQWWGQNGWSVFPQREDKSPLIPNPHPRGDPARWGCKGRCGQDGHGHYDATTDINRFRLWAKTYGFDWGGIAGRLPKNVVALDSDPRNGGDKSLAALQSRYGDLPPTQEHISGRGDGGRHLLLQVPEGLRLSGQALRGKGIDLKDNSGAIRLPPSFHPAALGSVGSLGCCVNPASYGPVNSGRYRLVPRPIAPAPTWLLRLLLASPTRAGQTKVVQEDSIADWFADTVSWGDVLRKFNWTCVEGDGDADGSRWRHPHATSDSSASIAHGLLFVFSPNTAFEPTSGGDPHGYTKFRAYAVLEHEGDMKNAARALGAEREAGEW